MKRILVLVCFTAMVFSFPLFVRAEEEAQKVMDEGMLKVDAQEKDMARPHGWMRSGMGSIMGMSRKHDMMKGMMECKIVATSDGGVVVMMGHKLMKFDKDLNLVKEVELKMDMEGMKKMMEQLQENCPMFEMMKDKEVKPATEEAAQ